VTFLEGAPASVFETHVSTIFFTADRAYKFLKPVNLGFLDFTDRATRLQAVEDEFSLNRRFAPDVYLGVADLGEEGGLGERAIIMRRLPHERRLAALVGDPCFEDCLRAVARRVAVVHAGAPSHPRAAKYASRDAVRTNWDDNLDVIERAVGSAVGRNEFDGVAELAHRFLDHHEPLFERRLEEGMVRDGHGDLLAEDIFCLDDGPRILDCLAFREDLRVGDVLLDIGFLVMDVHRCAGIDPAMKLLRWYQEFSNEHHPEPLAHHYVAYRAGVRAKVAQLRVEQGDASASGAVSELVMLCRHHLDASRSKLVLVGGAPGVGKSTLAKEIGRQLEVAVLATDEIRKDVVGIERDRHAFAEPGHGIYEPERVAAVYDELLREATLVLEQGESVVLDASWTSSAERARAREIGQRLGAELVEIECRLALDQARTRLQQRLASSATLSDATPEVLEMLASTRDPWPEASTLDMSAAPDRVASWAARLISEH
jgi:aminoglycoside phosphotransferase family enzyme/predicted kinase